MSSLPGLEFGEKPVRARMSALQSELQAREFLTNLSKELHMTRRRLRDSHPSGATMPDVTPAVLTAAATPGTSDIKTASSTYPAQDAYSLIQSPRIRERGGRYSRTSPFGSRFRASTMDTTTKHANVDADPSAFNLGRTRPSSA